ncbi:MAG: CoA transferase [Neomegalonema sp.]|nr:CoA transferase [Neomegalonema sp.]
MSALGGVKVVDLTRVLGGPFCTQYLADHGAEVIKIEPPQGDETRAWGPPFDADGAASYFLGVNRNKRGMALDLRQEAARAVLLRLLESADVLIENFKTGTLEKWGLGYRAVLAERFPRLIHCRISGFGEDGPFGGLPGYDAIVQAQSGLMSVNGTAETGPVRLGIPLVDIGTGLASAFAISTALYERERSGQGQFIDMTLYDCAISMLFPYGANYFLSGKRPGPRGNRHPNLSPYDQFATKTCPIFIGCGNDRQFAVLCAVLDVPELAQDPRFATNAQRLAHEDALGERLSALLAEREGEAIADQLVRAGCPAGPVLGAPEVLAHPHTQHRAMVLESETPQGARYQGLANPVKFSRSETALRKTPPRFGEDTRAVLAELGYDAAQIEALLASGAALAGEG